MTLKIRILLVLFFNSKILSISEALLTTNLLKQILSEVFFVSLYFLKINFKMMSLSHE